MKLTARIYEINKGKDVRCSYFATVKKQECEKLKLKEKEAYLLMLNNSFFPVVIRRSNSGIGRFMLGFTIPRKIGKSLSTKKDYDFDLVSKSVSLVKKCKSNDTLNLMNLIPEKSSHQQQLTIFMQKNRSGSKVKLFG